ncbi:MAG: hypothetical protein IJ435_03745 [Clostridia bacterium]|nr:hypothetical protein [Clostridia bacterium]
MIYSVEELVPVFGLNYSGFCDLEETEQIELINRLAIRAEAYIDRMSFYRLRGICEEYAEDVKLVICKVCELMHREAESGNVASESTDGYAVTYKESSSVYLKGKIKEVCMDVLGHTGIFERTIGVI